MLKLVQHDNPDMKQVLIKLLKDRYFQIALLLLIIGAFLRFYKIYDFVTFLGDQGRDAIIMRRILTFEHFPAIGAPTSVGMVYLGPFYYYFIAPWLLFFNYNPIGPVVGVALFSSLFIPVLYLTLSDLVGNKVVGLIAATFVTFSSVLIDFSRFSWNPNLLPYFAFLTVYFMIKAQKTEQIKYFLLAGAFLSFSIQLHYLALFLGLIMAIQLLTILYTDRKNILTWIRKSTSFSGSFLLFSSPLIIFDLRHNFLNAKNFLQLYQQGNSVATDKLSSITNAFSILNLYTFQFQLVPILATIILTIFVIITLFFFRKKDVMGWVGLSFLALLLGVALYSGPKYPHYFGALFVLYISFIVGLFKYISNNKFQIAIGLLAISAYFFVSMPGYMFLRENPSMQISASENVANAIYEQVTHDTYQLTGLPNKYSDSAYRYFLELRGKRPLEHDTLEKAEELFVICEQECKIIGDPQWEIAYFAPRKIVGHWDVEGIKIYKLVH